MSSKLVGVNIWVTLMFALLAAVVCVPTSVLVQNSELNNNNLKVKRSSPGGKDSHNDPTLDQFNYKKSKLKDLQSLSTPSPANVEIVSAAESTNNRRDGDRYDSRDEAPTMLHKRGINSRLMYGLGNGAGSNVGVADLYNNQMLSSGPIPNGVWTDEIDPALVYSDVPDFDEYSRAQYRNKAYDNLQNILNSEAYIEPVALPLQYANRYYGADRKKRSNRNKLNKYDMRLKRESKLTPADMLALVALVEAGERSRKESDTEPDSYPAPEAYNPKAFYPGYQAYQNNENDNEYNNGMNAWLEPVGIDYYGMPYNMEALPKYEMAREHKYGGNRYPAKRFMVSKKKRSIGHFPNESLENKPPGITLRPSKIRAYF